MAHSRFGRTIVVWVRGIRLESLLPRVSASLNVASSKPFGDASVRRKGRAARRRQDNAQTKGDAPGGRAGFREVAANSPLAPHGTCFSGRSNRVNGWKPCLARVAENRCLPVCCPAQWQHE